MSALVEVEVREWDLVAVTRQQRAPEVEERRDLFGGQESYR